MTEEGHGIWVSPEQVREQQERGGDVAHKVAGAPGTAGPFRWSMPLGVLPLEPQASWPPLSGPRGSEIRQVLPGGRGQRCPPTHLL